MWRVPCTNMRRNQSGLGIVPPSSTHLIVNFAQYRMYLRNIHYVSMLDHRCCAARTPPIHCVCAAQGAFPLWFAEAVELDRGRVARPGGGSLRAVQRICVVFMVRIPGGAIRVHHVATRGCRCFGRVIAYCQLSHYVSNRGAN